jgi:hypothetical protein
MKGARFPHLPTCFNGGEDSRQALRHASLQQFLELGESFIHRFREGDEF